MKLIVSAVILLCNLFPSDQIPAPEQDHSIMLRGATIHTVSHGTLANGDLIFDQGKIIAVGKNIAKIPYGTEVIDVKDQHIFPGLISSISTLGLQEIGAVRACTNFL